MVFDSGSQRSYISEILQKTLNLPIAGQDTLLIKTFGESTAKLRRCDIVQMAVEADDGMQVYVSAYVVPVIGAPISNQLIEFTQANYPHLQCLRLADNSHGDEELNIDILIGAVFYWHFVSGSVIRGTQDQVLLPFQPGLVMCFLDRLEFQCQSRETLQLTLLKLVCSKSRTM